MASLFLQGGWFMVPLTVLLLIIIAIAVYRTIQITKNKVSHETSFRHELARIKSIGLFTLILGILAQFAGIYQMLSVLEAPKTLPTTLLATGFKLTIIPLLYGVMIFLFSYIIWFGLDSWINNKAVT